MNNPQSAIRNSQFAIELGYNQAVGEIIRLALAEDIGRGDITTDATVPAGPGVHPVSDAARAAGFVDVRGAVPDAVIDLRYATTNNFTHIQQYPSDARCLVHQSMAPGLATAALPLNVMWYSGDGLTPLMPSGAV